MSKMPLATYRIQFNSSYRFEHAIEIVDYLADLGITHLYASPIFKAKKGSTHGYDVVDPNQINPELGTSDDFERLSSELRKLNLGLVQDIVPNHMSVDYENTMLTDVLENGINSKFFNFFDIEWDHPYESIKGRLLLPFLGKFYGECLESGEIKIVYNENGFTVNYYDLKFPLKLESYANILQYGVSSLKNKIGKEHSDYLKLLGLIFVLRNLESAEEIGERYDQTRFVKRMLWELYTSNSEFRDFLNRNVEIFNNANGPNIGYNLLDSLLSEQLYRLSFWKVTTEETNYRRFFNINGLISLRVEDEDVFERSHRLILNMVGQGIFSGLRIDHIDGLYDPTAYLQRLRKRVGEIYVIVEKILEFDEELPSQWPIEGTSGYDFLNYLNSIFCKFANEREFNRLYSSFIQSRPFYRELVYEKKKLIIDKDMSGDVDNLAHLMKRISAKDRYGNDITLNGLRRAIVELLAFFPVYRSYIDESSAEATGLQYIEEAVNRAKGARPDLVYELDFLHRFLNLDFPDHFSEEEKRSWIKWVMRFQQMSGPLMAKGFEDTTLYIYNRLISLNEVGGNPSRFGISLETFHKFNRKRAQTHPFSMNATATHDTKRGEDVRARLNVLSEIPQEWEAKIRIWNRLNRDKRTPYNGSEAPDKNDEYFFYQTILGAYPFHASEMGNFIDRIKEYLVKAIREAKIHTEWLKPDSAYEDAFTNFAEKVLSGSEDTNYFLKSFLPFQKKIEHYGILNSLSQVLIKTCATGVPDFYQGTEFWDLSLVDPDNRRSVDFQKRIDALSELKQADRSNQDELIRELWESRQDGRIKMYLIYKALSARLANADVFQNGTYCSVPVRGKLKNHVIAFARKTESAWAVILTGRFFTSLVKQDQFPVGDKTWGDTLISIPNGCPPVWKDAITGQEIQILKWLRLSQILNKFPCAILIGNC